MKDIFYLVCFLFSFNIAHAQAIELIPVKTFAKENATTTFRCRIPAKYDKSSVAKYPLLIQYYYWKRRRKLLNGTAWRSLNVAAQNTLTSRT